ncbi:fimbria/pilus periplasmic chaperone [Erwinia sp. CPCC 100877]|nr:fimbria/pilus periplasmic chaperone [Erwinia sp. CPCC 100877]
MKNQYAVFLKFITACIFLAFTAQTAFSAMTISGTRIIFPGGEREKTVRTTNRGKTPLLAQVWVDDGSNNEDINSIKVPFTTTPPVFRVEPGKGQSVRLIYNGMALPQDRESVFWFNLLEIPPVNDAVSDTNRLELAFRTRIKIFYRPKVLKSSGTQEVNNIKWEMLSPARGIKVINPTPYYLSFDSGYILSGGVKYPLVMDMVSPFSSKEMLIENKKSAPASISSASVQMINDYGSVEKYQLVPSAGKGLVIKAQQQ